MRSLLLAASVLPVAGVTSAIAPARAIASLGWAARRAWTIDPDFATIGQVLLLGLSLGRDVVIRPAGARGNGVFALRDLEPYTLVGWYTGTILSEAEQREKVYSDPAYSGDYIMTLGVSDNPDPEGQGWLIDGEDAQTAGWTRYINHSVRNQNVGAFFLAPRPQLPPKFGAIYIEVTKPIKAGEELLLDYGKEYWDDRVPMVFRPLQRITIDYL